MRLVLFAIILFFATSLHASEDLHVEFGDAQINLSTDPDSSWNFMDVHLYLKGDGIRKSKMYFDPVYTRIETETSNLNKKMESPNRSRKIWRAKNIENKASEIRLWERFDPPSRKDNTLYIEGIIEVVREIPKENVVIINNYLDIAGQTIGNTLLSKNGIEITFLTKDQMVDIQEKEKEENKNQNAKDLSEKALLKVFKEAFSSMFGFGGISDLTFIIKDPEDKLINIELTNDKDETIEQESKSFSYDDETGVAKYGIDFKKMLPYKGKIKFYVEDEKKVVKIPFSHQVKLP